MWLPERGKNGCPVTARELVEDAEAIVEMIKEVYRQLGNVLHPELSDEQSAKCDEIYNAVYEMRKVVAGDEKKRRKRIMEKNEITKVLAGLKSLLDTGIIQEFKQKRALKEAVKHYERLQKEKEVDRVRVVLQIVVTGEDIDDIMVSALEGGITYWCSKAKVDGRSLGKYASEQISQGGTLILHDMEEDRSELLTKEKLLQGIKMYAEQPKHGDIFEVIDHELHIDCGMVDAEVADAIIQYAIFADIIYG